MRALQEYGPVQPTLATGVVGTYEIVILRMNEIPTPTEPKPISKLGNESKTVAPPVIPETKP